MATQIAETPVLYGSDAQSVLKQVSKKPTPQELSSLKKSLHQKFSSINTERR